MIAELKLSVHVNYYVYQEAAGFYYKLSWIMNSLSLELLNDDFAFN